MNKVALAGLVASAVSLSSVALADETPAAESSPSAQHSINLSPLGVAFGSYALNYEYLANGGHGVLVEGTFGTGKDTDGNTNRDFGGAVGYRYHFSGKQSSWFAGPMLSFASGSGSGTVQVNEGPKKTFDVSYTSLAVTANVGRRWTIADVANITFRLGGGKAFRNFSTTSTDPDAQTAVNLVQGLVDFLPIALDGELSVGVNF